MNEYMTTISMGDGYGQVTGCPHAVIVYINVSTQASHHGVRNISVGHLLMSLASSHCNRYWNRKYTLAREQPMSENYCNIVLPES
jgi:hypothetical protein